MSASFVQVVAAGTVNGNDVVMSVVNPPTVGNTLIVGMMAGFNAGSGTCSDSKSNSYALDQWRAGGGLAVGQFRATVTNALTTSDHITAHSNGLGTNQYAVVLEFAGIAATSPVDRANIANVNNVNNITIGLGGVTAQANEMIIATAALQTTGQTSFSATSGWSFVAPQLAPWNISPFPGMVAYKLDTAAGDTPSVNLADDGSASSSTSNAVIVAYKSAAIIQNLTPSASATSQAAASIVAVTNFLANASSIAQALATAGAGVPFLVLSARAITQTHANISFPVPVFLSPNATAITETNLIVDAPNTNIPLEDLSAAAITEADLTVSVPYFPYLSSIASAITTASVLVMVPVQLEPESVAISSAINSIWFIGGRFVEIRAGSDSEVVFQPQPEYEWILCKKPSTLYGASAIYTNPAEIEFLAAIVQQEYTSGGQIEPIGIDWPSQFIDEPLITTGILNNAQNRTFQLAANRAGSAQFTLRTSDDMAAEILDGVDFGDVRGTVRHCLRIRRNKVDLWSGPIWGIQGDLDAGTLTVSCVGWLETLQHRLLWTPNDYSNNGLGLPPDTIAFDVLGKLVLQDMNHPPYVIPGNVMGNRVTGSFAQNRLEVYNRGQNVGQALQDLSDIEDGYDYEVNPLTRRLNLMDSSIFTTRRDIKLGYNWGPSNLKNVQWQEDASKTCNFMSVQSQQGGAPITVDDSVSIDQYGLFEESNTITANTAILVPYGLAEIAIRSRPLVIYSLIPQPFGPRLFDDFQIRDEVFFTARKDHFQVNNQGIRVFGATVQIDDNGNETISELQTAPSS